jgi:hypothetical protein
MNKMIFVQYPAGPFQDESADMGDIIEVDTEDATGEIFVRGVEKDKAMFIIECINYYVKHN